ncbi:unnamed protein product [Brassicogethes aeneus]|uniref:Uncharacterized protein n=1 Tax=Brassicogethes aeneus TaxID=1431903 RepID=A0A9P0B9S8_BRAAE|nr:unnamed protein product [Brassicogethes aeneus]
MRGHSTLVLLFFLFCCEIASAAPISQRDGRDVVFVPARYIPFPLDPAYLKGPLSFIGDWINGSEWFPVELNVPDSFAAIGNGIQGFGNGIGTFAQGVGSNFGNFAQNLGNNWNNFALNVGNRFHNITQKLPVLNNFYHRPIAMAQNTRFGTKYVVVMPKSEDKLQNELKFDPFEGEDDFTSFP